jgi:hypothetical protein
VLSFYPKLSGVLPGAGLPSRPHPLFLQTKKQVSHDNCFSAYRLTGNMYCNSYIRDKCIKNFRYVSSFYPKLSDVLPNAVLPSRPHPLFLQTKKQVSRDNCFSVHQLTGEKNCISYNRDKCIKIFRSVSSFYPKLSGVLPGAVLPSRPHPLFLQTKKQVSRDNCFSVHRLTGEKYCFSYIRDKCIKIFPIRVVLLSEIIRCAGRRLAVTAVFANKKAGISRQLLFRLPANR